MAPTVKNRNQARDSDADPGFAGSELESPDAKRTRHAHPGFNFVSRRSICGLQNVTISS